MNNSYKKFQFFAVLEIKDLAANYKFHSLITNSVSHVFYAEQLCIKLEILELSSSPKKFEGI